MDLKIFPTSPVTTQKLSSNFKLDIPFSDGTKEKDSDGEEEEEKKKKDDEKPSKVANIEETCTGEHSLERPLALSLIRNQTY